jgi:hypothetical protein
MITDGQQGVVDRWVENTAIDHVDVFPPSGKQKGTIIVHCWNADGELIGVGTIPLEGTWELHVPSDYELETAKIIKDYLSRT